MDSDEDMENDEVLEYETATLASLRGKELIVRNTDGTLRCPLSPSRKKQAYAYKDLLQHATAVAVGKRGPEAAGQHSALKKFLESDLLSLATPAVERLLKLQQELPRRREAEDMLVCPWSVVIYNIDNSQRDSEKNIQIGFGRSELKIYFADFNPDRVHVFWGPEGHRGMSVLHFGRELSGLKDAQALEKSFLDKEHGRRDYERRSACKNLGKDFYGWLAREEDYMGKSDHQGAEMATYLRGYGNLKDIGMVGDEMRRIHDQQVRQLAVTVSERNEESLHLKTEMEIIRRRAEADRLALEESHKLELEAVRVKAQNSEDEYNKATLESNQALEKKEAELRQLDKELQEKDSDLKSAAEKTQLATQMMENRQLREMISKQQGQLKRHQADKVKLVQKHEEETRRLSERTHNESLWLAKKQKIELEKHQLQDMLETEKIFDRLTIKEDTGPENKKIEELQKKLEEQESDQEFNNELMNSLLMKEREATKEIATARNMSAKIMEDLDEDQAKGVIEAAIERRKHRHIGFKRAGSVDERPWIAAFQKKFKNKGDWGEKMAKEFSSWEACVKDHNFQPFRKVHTGDTFKQEIDYEDKLLSSLKNDLGEEVLNSVTTALMEVEEFNPSGRYPVPMAWNFKESRAAKLAEVIAHCGVVIKALVAQIASNAPRKKART